MWTQTVFSQAAKSRWIASWRGAPVWVGAAGGAGDGIVIAANRIAKKFGVKTGMACFEAAAVFAPKGVLCRPQYEKYRELSQKMFRVLEKYSPTLVPISIDEGFLDFTTMDKYVWRNTTPMDYIKQIGERIRKGKAACRVSGELGHFMSARQTRQPDAACSASSKFPRARKKNFSRTALSASCLACPKTANARCPPWAQKHLAKWPNCPRCY